MLLRIAPGESHLSHRESPRAPKMQGYQSLKNKFSLFMRRVYRHQSLDTKNTSNNVIRGACFLQRFHTSTIPSLYLFYIMSHIILLRCHYY